jgi:hypothetical protein
MHSSLWLVAIGIVLLSQGILRFAQRVPAKTQEPSQARVSTVRTALFWVGLFLTIWAARIAFIKR